MIAAAPSEIQKDEKKSSGAWLFNPTVDLLIGCGAWSLPLLFLTYLASQRALSAVAFGFYFLAVFCNNPHYMATVYRAYGSQRDFAKYRFFTLYVTILLLATLIVLHWKPALLPFVFTTYIIWSPWHYTGQNFGIAMMMARRNGASPKHSDRNLIYFSYLSSFILWAVMLNSIELEDPHILSLGIPAGIARPLQMLLISISLVTGIEGLRRLTAQSSWKKMAAPAVLFITQQLWFVVPSVMQLFFHTQLSPLFYSTGMLAFMHCAQYLWVTTYFSQREVLAEGATKKAWSFRKYYFVLVAGGIALFIPGPWLISRVFGHDLVESMFIFIALVNIHHFILDGAIWKLRDGKIARLLLGNPPPAETSEAEEKGGFIPFAKWLFGGSKTAFYLRIGFIAIVLLVGAVDQFQNYLTLEKTSLARLKTAEFFNNHDTRIFFQRAKILEQQGAINAALQQLDAVIALNPNSLPAQSMRGSLLARQGRTSEAFQQFEEMTTRFRPMPTVLINAGAFAVFADQPAKAVAHYEKALELNPKNLELHLSLAEALQRSGDFKQAIAHYSIYISAMNQKAGQHDKKLFLAEMKLAESCVVLGLFDKAIWWYRAAATQAQAAGETEIAQECSARGNKLEEAITRSKPKVK